jgi:hypothetical protein
MAKPSTRSDLVYTVLRRAVIEQALAPGAKLLEWCAPRCRSWPAMGSSR